MTAHSLILTPHEVLAALRGELGLVVRPVKGLGDIDFTSVRLSSFHSLWGPDAWVFETPMDKGVTGFEAISRGLQCPLGVPGDRLIGKEAWADVNTDSGPAFTYRVDHGLHFCQEDAFPVEYNRYPGMSFAMWCGDLWRGEPGHTWRRAQHMPAWASRITLEVVGVRCVRFDELSHADAKFCGFIDDGLGHFIPMQHAWNARYSKRGLGWETNPFVWAVEVRRVGG